MSQCGCVSVSVTQCVCVSMCHLPETIPILKPKKKPTAAPPRPAQTSQSVERSLQSQADSWITWEEARGARCSERRAAVELDVSGLTVLEDMASWRTGPSSALTVSIVQLTRSRYYPLARHTLF